MYFFARGKELPTKPWLQHQRICREQKTGAVCTPVFVCPDDESEKHALSPVATQIIRFWQPSPAWPPYSNLREPNLSSFRSTWEVNLSGVWSETFVIFAKCPGPRLWQDWLSEYKWATSARTAVSETWVSLWLIPSSNEFMSSHSQHSFALRL